ncbi:hypothetical protein COW36_00755 [bacterium (Candidatus Blackallbacteria) CG17_big_fil_post_rev_8_21_14_2_50_48_46]|uniref:Uncharacterized protein n=1 Tax=bacterium (Candidatus Blackallbacteria) CG17_big_fil_post_rev_8_21_14_2_50_48_46 TaxID=2014261 RepID=A0A2M7GB96_9BACT|nr:MAG: hypothetical protein COW64_10420 [bacterium (Candidatus Blackallbacteria) CG18_big_fil_WC_8_21_14_2_50_49_26]PIW19400.1 MAG: hypothetical protein COW36_00755 [bacterium (Candidatus Blackallbacteria) CG17_big_fil_post_rev_8_21_14_2_50_48_46]PIW48996.1 MAG: hypothetical protein COW20_07700 [bacterium (Candidatus Blackallbacteria) CG13_big_fil_rev_8_21_14_2_50_49_14]
MSSINRLNGNSGFDFSVKSGRTQKASAGASAAPSSGVQGASAKPSTAKNEDSLSISSVVGAAGGAATQVSLGGSASLPATVAVSALKGAAAQMTKEQRDAMTLSEMARQLVDEMFAA